MSPGKGIVLCTAKHPNIPALIADNQMRSRYECFENQDKYKSKPDPLSEKTENRLLDEPGVDQLSLKISLFATPPVKGFGECVDADVKLTQAADIQ